MICFCFLFWSENTVFIYCETTFLWNSLLGGKETQSGFFESGFEILFSRYIINIIRASKFISSMSVYDQRALSVISQLSDVSDFEHKSGPYLEGNLKLLDTMWVSLTLSPSLSPLSLPLSNIPHRSSLLSSVTPLILFFFFLSPSFVEICKTYTELCQVSVF